MRTLKVWTAAAVVALSGLHAGVSSAGGGTTVSGTLANSATPGNCTLTWKVRSPEYANNTYTIYYEVRSTRSGTNFSGTASPTLSTSTSISTFSGTFDVSASTYSAANGAYLHLKLTSSSSPGYVGYIDLSVSGNRCK